MNEAHLWIGGALVLAVSCGVASARQSDGGAPGADGNVVRYDGHSVVRVTTRSARELLAVNALADSIWSHAIGVGPLDVQLAPGKADALGDLGIPFDVLIPDVQVLIDAERSQIAAAHADGGFAGREDAWFLTYRTFAEISGRLDLYAANNPTIVTVQQAGLSLQSRPIRAVRISAPDTPENPRSGRIQVFFNGCQHAREWISPMTVMYIAESLIEGWNNNDARLRSLLSKVEFIIVPVVNPDGYEFTWSTNRLWRKNRRSNGDGSIGVDLNRNWSVGWGGNDGSSSSPSSDVYRGPAAFSEPETASLRDFMLANPRIVASIDFHSYSQLILSPWGYTETLPPDAALFDTINTRMRDAIASVNGLFYTAGPTATTIYIASGTASDWTYGAIDGLGYGIELRDTGANGFILPADQILPTGRENLQGALALAEFAATPVAISFPGGVPTSLEAGVGTTFDVRIDSASGTLDPSSARLFQRTAGGTFTSTPLAPLGGAIFRATLPAEGCGRVLEFYVEAAATSGQVVRSPDAAPALVYSAASTQTTVAFDDACEAVNGWTVGAPGDNATTGLWGNGVPQATTAQPGADHSVGGTRCWMTDVRAGSAAGDFDIDGGTTTLTSPRMSAVVNGTASPDAAISYWRWYSNNAGARPGTNTMLVQISGNDGATWTQLELVSDSTGQWTNREFRIGDFVTPSDSIRVRFVARDLTGSLVEAGVDDVRLVVRGCPPNPADFNGDGFVDFFDFDDFVTCFEGGACPPGKSADFNNDGFVDFFDFDDFVIAFNG
jgi:murein tripeptide amidase MpaA